MMNKNKKAIAFTAFMIFISLLIVTSLFFGIKSTLSSPLGKTIIKYFVYPDGTPIGECLKVQLWDGGVGDQPYKIGHTDADGKVVFDHLVDETFTIEYYWQGVHYAETCRINCSRIVWEFTNKVPYWTLEKTFVYPDGTPVVGLDVYFDGQSDITDASGKVTFTDLKACVDYTISWSWQGVPCSELVHIYDFQTPSLIKMTNNCPCWTVEKTFTYPDGTPIEGLEVTFAPPPGPIAKPPQKGITDADGKVSFTCLKVCVTYTFDWQWQGVRYQETVHVADFQTPPLVELENVLPYWEIIKTFYYEEAGIPVSHLTVKCDGMEEVTDESGTVVFSDLKAGTYTLEWVWGNVTKTEEVIIGFQTPTPVELTNYVELKSGGGQTVGGYILPILG